MARITDGSGLEEHVVRVNRVAKVVKRKIRLHYRFLHQLACHLLIPGNLHGKALCHRPVSLDQYAKGILISAECQRQQSWICTFIHRVVTWKPPLLDASM